MIKQEDFGQSKIKNFAWQSQRGGGQLQGDIILWFDCINAVLIILSRQLQFWFGMQTFPINFVFSYLK